MSDQVEYQPAAVTEDKTMPMVVYILYLLSFLTAGFTSLVGLVIAYANRGVAGPVQASHYDFQIRTFWIGLVAMLVSGATMFWGFIFSFILIGIPFLILGKLMLGATGVWFAVRTILGLVYLLRGEAHARPRTWLF